MAINADVTNNASEELKKFKSIFGTDESFIEYYRGLYPTYKKVLNVSALKEGNASVLDLERKTDRLSGLINDVETLGVDVSEIRFSVDSVLNIQSSSAKYFKLENIIRELTNKYGRYLSVKNMLISIKNNPNLCDNVDNLNFCIDFFLRELNTLKRDDNFVNDELSRYVGDFYTIGVNLMLKEFVVKGSSNLFDYFNNSEHDYSLVSNIIYMKIESLWNSERQVYGLNELDRVVGKKGVYLDKDVLVQLLICINSKMVSKFLKLKIKEYIVKLGEVYNSSKCCYEKYVNSDINFFEYLILRNKLSKHYKMILREYDEFMSSYKYFFDGNVNVLKSKVKRMTYGLTHNRY